MKHHLNIRPWTQPTHEMQSTVIPPGKRKTNMAELNLHFRVWDTKLCELLSDSNKERAIVFSRPWFAYFYTALSRNVQLSAASVKTPFKCESQEYMQLEGMCFVVRHTHTHKDIAKWGVCLKSCMLSWQWMAIELYVVGGLNMTVVSEDKIKPDAGARKIHYSCRYHLYIVKINFVNVITCNEF